MGGLSVCVVGVLGVVLLHFDLFISILNKKLSSHDG